MSVSKNVTTPATIEWMSVYQSTVLKRFGYSSTRGCGKARLCPAFSLPDLFAGAAGGSSSGSRRLSARAYRNPDDAMTPAITAPGPSS